MHKKRMILKLQHVYQIAIYEISCLSNVNLPNYIRHIYINLMSTPNNLKIIRWKFYENIKQYIECFDSIPTMFFGNVELSLLVSCPFCFCRTFKVMANLSLDLLIVHKSLFVDH